MSNEYSIFTDCAKAVPRVCVYGDDRTDRHPGSCTAGSRWHWHSTGPGFRHMLHHAANEPLHGASMRAELAHHGFAISPGTLYPTSDRMENDGPLLSAKNTVDGRALRTYPATDAGREALREGQRAIRELASEILSPEIITIEGESLDDHG